MVVLLMELLVVEVPRKVVLLVRLLIVLVLNVPWGNQECEFFLMIVGI